MKRIFLLLFSMIVIACYSQQAAGYNGWEFLHWRITEDSVNMIVEQHKAEFADANALDALFKYHDLNTWFEYNDNHQLIKVRQRTEFSVNRDEEVKQLFIATRDRLINTYGKPLKKEADRKECVVNLYWELKYTRISLNYDYKYKIIDEFGAGSYWVAVVFEPR
jgi:hypothetical protein